MNKEIEFRGAGEGLHFVKVEEVADSDSCQVR